MGKGIGVQLVAKYMACGCNSRALALCLKCGELRLFSRFCCVILKVLRYDTH